jgi:NADH pyrophosphatase NudC (nudix superfamily)
MIDWKFCPRCGSPAARQGQGADEHIACQRCEFVKYDNPLPTTIGLVVDGDAVLLIRRSIEPALGEWDAVGGFLSGSETAEENLARECIEETGLRLKSMQFIGSFSSVYGATRAKTIGIAFECVADNAEGIRLSDENSEFSWFKLDQLPRVAFSDVSKALQELATQMRLR